VRAADEDDLARELGERLLITPDTVELVDELEAGGGIVDNRYQSSPRNRRAVREKMSR